MPIFELLGMADTDPDPSDWVFPYERGLAAYRERKFERALACFEEAFGLRPHDGPSIAMIERCRRFLKAPPGDEWNGMSVAESK